MCIIVTKTDFSFAGFIRGIPVFGADPAIAQRFESLGAGEDFITDHLWNSGYDFEADELRAIEL